MPRHGGWPDTSTHLPARVPRRHGCGDGAMTRYDIIVVGAGPAGIAAATAAARSGSRVLLLDENPSPGGQIWRSGRPMSLTQPSEGESARRHAVEQLKASGASLLCGYSVYDAPAAGELRAIC